MFVIVFKITWELGITWGHNEETLNNDLKEIQKQNYFKYNLELNEIYYLLKHETITDNKLKQNLLNYISVDYYETKYIFFTKKEETEILKKYDTLLNYYTQINNNYISSLERIININKFEKFINGVIYDVIFIDYLKKMKYIINDCRPKNENGEIRKDADIKEKSILEKIDIKYNIIENINKSQVEEYIEKEKKGTGITFEEKLEKEKYFFNSLFNNPTDKDERNIYIFEKIYSCKGENKEKFII